MQQPTSGAKARPLSRFSGTTEVVPFPLSVACKLVAFRQTTSQEPIRTSLPSFNSKESPRQTTLCPNRLAIQTSNATKSRSGSSGSSRNTWRSRKTDHPDEQRHGNRRPVTAASKIHAHESTATQNSQRQQRPGQTESQHQPEISPAPRIAHGAAPAQLMIQKLAQRVGGKKCFDHHIGQLHFQSSLARCACRFRSRQPDNPPSLRNRRWLRDRAAGKQAWNPVQSGCRLRVAAPPTRRRKIRADAERFQSRSQGRAGNAAIKTSHQARLCGSASGAVHSPQVVGLNPDVAVVDENVFVLRLRQHLRQIADFGIGAQILRDRPSGESRSCGNSAFNRSTSSIAGSAGSLTPKIISYSG